MIIRWIVYVIEPATGDYRPQVVTYRAREAIELVMEMRREMPGVGCGAVGRLLRAEELAALGGREVWE